jgi:class 3 adenylate cyclase
MHLDQMIIGMINAHSILDRMARRLVRAHPVCIAQSCHSRSTRRRHLVQVCRLYDCSAVHRRRTGPSSGLPAPPVPPAVVKAGLRQPRVLCSPGAYTSAMATCQRCKEENPQRARFCLACGAALASPVPQARKTVTVVFVDLVGSTDLGERLDPESLTRVMAEYFRCARSALEFHGGTVQKFIGDAVMAVFGVPVLHEDDALRAVRAALELRAQVAELNVELGRNAGMTLRIRIGVNTGEVVVGDPEIGDALVLGDAVNLAARLEQAAAPGEILLGQETWRLVRDGVVAEPLAPLAVKGKQRPVRSWRLEGLRPDSPARLTRAGAPMVGRVGERAVLDRAWARALADQGCRAVTVVGPPGIGKSRMATEALADREREATLLSGRCLPYGRGITFWPLVEVVGRAAHLAETDTPEAAHARLRVLLETDPAVLPGPSRAVGGTPRLAAGQGQRRAGPAGAAVGRRVS